MFEVLGQETSKKSFNNAFNNNKISHAYMITGPDGTGKSVFALYMASKILCTGEEKPCGVCPCCNKVLHNNHPDLKVLSTKFKNTRIDEIRDIIDEIYVKPYEGDKKVVIIKKADTITTQGQNAILKTLEETIEDTTIILIVENLSRMLQTIQSRCQILKFARVKNSMIENYLIQNGTDDKKAKTAASLSDGILGNALNFLDNEFLHLRQQTIEMCGRIIRDDGTQVFDFANYFIENKDKINEILDMILIWFRDIIVIKFASDKSLIINKDLMDKLISDSENISFEHLSKIIDIIKETKASLKYNLNFQLAMEVMLMNMQQK